MLPRGTWSVLFSPCPIYIDMVLLLSTQIKCWLRRRSCSVAYGRVRAQGRLSGLLDGNKQKKKCGIPWGWHQDVTQGWGSGCCWSQAPSGLLVWFRFFLLGFWCGSVCVKRGWYPQAGLCCVLLGHRGHVGAHSICWVPVALPLQ